MYKITKDPKKWGVYEYSICEGMLRVTYGYDTDCPYAEMDLSMNISSYNYCKLFVGEYYVDEIAANMGKIIIRDKCGKYVPPLRRE